MQKMNLGSRESTVTLGSPKSLRLCLFFVGNEKSSRKTIPMMLTLSLWCLYIFIPFQKKTVSKNKDQPNQKHQEHQGKVSIFHHGSLCCCFVFCALSHARNGFFTHQGTWRQVLAPCIGPGCAANETLIHFKPFERPDLISLLNICTVIPKKV